MKSSVVGKQLLQRLIVMPCIVLPPWLESYLREVQKREAETVREMDRIK